MNDLPARCRLRLVTQNLWHGLDHTNPYLMWPLENPVKRLLRRHGQRTALKDLLTEPERVEATAEKISEEILDVFCLQEMNPVRRRLKEFREALEMHGESFAVNVGVRAGDLSYPPFLQEGLGILWRGSLIDAASENRILSGHATEIMAPFKTPLTLQLAERRGAMLISGRWVGKQFTFVNLHLHNGAADLASRAERRCREVDVLVEWLEPWIQSSDAIFVAGDFNCEHGAAELSPLAAAGFQEVLTAMGEPIVTWDPELNPLARQGRDLNKNHIEHAWDSRRHQLDHIFYRVKGRSWGKREDSPPPWTFRVERVLDKPLMGAWPSDHFGLRVEISWATR